MRNHTLTNEELNALVEYVKANLVYSQAAIVLKWVETVVKNSEERAKAAELAEAPKENVKK